LQHSSGVPSHQTRDELSRHQDLPQLSGITDDLKRKLEQGFGPAGHPSPKKPMLQDVKSAFDMMSEEQKILAAGGTGASVLAALASDRNKNPGELIQPPSIPEPASGISEGTVVLPHHFAKPEEQTTKEILDTAMGSNQQQLQISATGSVTFSSKQKKASITTPAQYMIACNRMVSYIRSRGDLNNYQTESDFILHNDYVAKIMGFFERFKFNFVIEFDVMVRMHVHAGTLQSFGADTTALFSKVFLERDDTRINTPPVQSPSEPKNKKQEKKTKTKEKPKAVRPHVKEDWPHTEKNGVQICKNYNMGRCLDHKQRDGTACTRKHTCAICLKDNCKAIDHK
jgi:hypothetical protein